MSELITRRTFLKTTGAAALAVAASGMRQAAGTESTVPHPAVRPFPPLTAALMPTLVPLC